MPDHLTSTTHGDAPLATAYAPDARASSLWATAEDDELTARTVTIDRPLEEVRAYLSEPSNLLTFWDTTEDEAHRITGRVDVRPAPAGRGTEVTVTLASPSRNPLTKLWDKITEDDPRIQSRRALRRFKQLMETGEIATSTPGPAAPRA